MSSQRVVLVCLAGLGLSLLLVGLVSSTLLRHVIQIIPIVVAIVLLSRRPPWGAYASVPLFVLWTLLMTLIWLFLLGVSRIASGRYTLTEIVLTVCMAVFSAVGAVAATRTGKPLRWSQRVTAITLFAIFQVAALWVSFQPAFANR